MAQQMLNHLPAAPIDARGFVADNCRALTGQLRVAPAAIGTNAIQVKEISREENSFLDSLPNEHPLTIAYVSTCQEDDCMIYVGPQVANLGFNQEAWLGKPELRLQHVHKEDLERVRQAMQHSRQTSEKFNCYYRLYDSTGRVHWFHDEASVVCGEAGEPLFVMGAMRDVTEMKTMEEELNEHRYYLEKKVEQRTEQLVRRITLLETCNATLCDKLAQARRDNTALRKQLARAISEAGSDDCLGQLTGISDGIRQRLEPDSSDALIGYAVSA